MSKIKIVAHIRDWTEDTLKIGSTEDRIRVFNINECHVVDNPAWLDIARPDEYFDYVCKEIMMKGLKSRSRCDDTFFPPSSIVRIEMEYHGERGE